jgi:hypothetical protein
MSSYYDDLLLKPTGIKVFVTKPDDTNPFNVKVHDVCTIESNNHVRSAKYIIPNFLEKGCAFESDEIPLMNKYYELEITDLEGQIDSYIALFLKV